MPAKKGQNQICQMKGKGEKVSTPSKQLYK